MALRTAPRERGLPRACEPDATETWKKYSAPSCQSISLIAPIHPWRGPERELKDGRHGVDHPTRFAPLADAFAKLRAPTLVLDGGRCADAERSRGVV